MAAREGGGAHEFAGMDIEYNEPPDTDPGFLEWFQAESPGDQRCVVTFSINKGPKTLSYQWSNDSLPLTPATHLVFQRKDGRLSRLVRCSKCQKWYLWAESEEESFRAGLREEDGEIFRGKACPCNHQAVR